MPHCLPIATRVVIRYEINGPSGLPTDARQALAHSLQPMDGVLGLHQRLTIQDSVAIVVDLVPTTLSVFDVESTALVVLKDSLRPHAAPPASDTSSGAATALTFSLSTTMHSKGTIRVSPTIRAMIDIVTRAETALLCNIPVRLELAAHESIETIYTIDVSDRALLIELANASRFCEFRLEGNALVGSSSIIFDRANLFELISCLFRSVPPPGAATTLAAVKIAPILPFNYRKMFVNEERLWSGLRSWLAANSQAPLWLREGQVIGIQGLDTDNCDDVEDSIEQTLQDLCPVVDTKADKDLSVDCPAADRIVFCEVVAIASSGNVANAQVGWGYYSSSTKLELADVSDVDGLALVPFESEANEKAFDISQLAAATMLSGAIDQCLAFSTAHEEALSDSADYASETSQPPMQSIIIHGEEANLPFEITMAVVKKHCLPFSIVDCRAKLAVSVPALIREGCSIERSLTAAVDSKKEHIPIRRPLALIVRHAEQLEGNELDAVERVLATNRGQLIVIFCHEKPGTGGGAGAATNSGEGGSSGISGAANLSCTLACSLISSIACGVPAEDDRIKIVSKLFTSNTWLPSLTLSASLVASWTVGFTVMDLVAYVNGVVASATGHHRLSLSLNPKAQLVLSDEDFLEGLSEYQQTHGLIVSSTKLQPVKWSDVGGLHEAKKEILETIQLPTKFPHLFKTGGMQRKMGILLFGPPGCGKTLLAKAVATEMNMNFLSVKGPELINQYVGESEKNVRDIFQRARDNAPCVLFFDELDALAPARGAKGDAGGAMDRIVSQLLVEMDGVDKGDGDVFIVAATNRPDMLDAALLRPGRFDQRCYLGPPETAEEKALALKALTRKFKLASDVDLNIISERLQAMAKYTGADLFALCSDAMLFAVEERIAQLKEAHLKGLDLDEEEDMKVQACHFDRALAQLQPSVTPEEFAKYERLRSNIVR